jgi:hypothetical protein
VTEVVGILADRAANSRDCDGGSRACSGALQTFLGDKAMVSGLLVYVWDYGFYQPQIAGPMAALRNTFAPRSRQWRLIAAAREEAAAGGSCLPVTTGLSTAARLAVGPMEAVLRSDTVGHLVLAVSPLPTTTEGKARAVELNVLKLAAFEANDFQALPVLQAELENLVSSDLAAAAAAAAATTETLLVGHGGAARAAMDRLSSAMVPPVEGQMDGGFWLREAFVEGDAVLGLSLAALLLEQLVLVPPTLPLCSQGAVINASEATLVAEVVVVEEPRAAGATAGSHRDEL